MSDCSLQRTVAYARSVCSTTEASELQATRRRDLSLEKPRLATSKVPVVPAEEQ
jgi:hypothetical protein